jgi:multiple antibiotic resistance protein
MDWQVDWHFAAQAFATAITIVDPIGMIPITAATTVDFDRTRRNRIIDTAVVVAGCVMLVMGLVGPYVFGYLGITLPAFGIAGGILLLLIAIDMLFGRPSGARATTEEEHVARQAEDPAVFPLAIPMLAGPGTIATVLLLVGLSHGSPVRIALVVLAYAVALALAWLCMRGAARYLSKLGTTGIHVITRLLGIILAALAVQFIINGLIQTPLFHR